MPLRRNSGAAPTRRKDVPPGMGDRKPPAGSSPADSGGDFMNQVNVCEHPLIAEKLAGLRDKMTPPHRFRELMAEVGTLLGVYALENLRTKPSTVTTPLQSAAVRIADQPIVLVAVLRAGLGMLPGLLSIAPEASVGHIGLYRNEETLNPVRYYVRLPKGLEHSLTILLDPMLATGGSAVEALRILKTDGASQ